MAEHTKQRLVDTTKGCFNCFYRSFEPEAYPCSRCKRNAPSEDKWQPRAEQTEPQVIMPKKCKGCDSASKIIEAYSRGYTDGANAVKAMPQSERSE